MSNPIPANERQNAQLMISAGVAAHKVGDLVLAESLLQRALDLEADNADALQLLGLLAEERADLGAAETLFRQSLTAQDAQPHVHLNLANLLVRRGALDEALSHCDSAVRLSPNSVQALQQRADVLIALQRPLDAEAPLRKAHRLQPGSVAARVGLAEICRNSGRAAEAETLLRQGLAGDAQNVFYNNNLGLLLSDGQRYDEALPLLMTLVQTAPERPEIFLNIGQCLVGMARLHEARNYFLKAIELAPGHHLAHDLLNKLLWDLGQFDHIGKSFTFAKHRFPDSPDIFEMSAAAMIDCGGLEAAEVDLRFAAQIRPASLSQCRLWTALRLAQNRPRDAVAIVRHGLALQPDDRDLWRRLAEAWLGAGNPRLALRAAAIVARLDPTNRFAAAYQGLSWRLLGDQRAEYFYDMERLVHSIDLPPPPDLAAALDQLDHVGHAAMGQILQGGQRSCAALFGRPDLALPLAQLAERLMGAARSFVLNLPDDSDHPFLSGKTGGLAWAKSWSIRVAEGGYYGGAIDAEGWLSGIYCVQTADQQPAHQPGWIRLGGDGAELTIRPRPGLLLLFPSYMAYQTVPAAAGQSSLSIAFTMKPV